MEVKTQAKYIKISPTKVRDITRVIKGKNALEAQSLLKFMNRKGAISLNKVLNTAIADAEHNFSLKKDSLIISEAYVDVGPKSKRYRPRARGAASPIMRKTSHITVVVSGEEELRKIKKTKEEKPEVKIDTPEIPEEKTIDKPVSKELDSKEKTDTKVKEVLKKDKEVQLKVDQPKAKKDEKETQETSKEEVKTEKEKKVEKPSLKDLAQDREKKATKEEKQKTREEGFQTEKKVKKQEKSGFWNKFFRRKTG